MVYIINSLAWCPMNRKGNKGFPGGASGKEPACQCRRYKRRQFDPWVGKIPWKGAWQPTPVFLPGEFQGQSSLVGYGPCGHKETQLKWLSMHSWDVTACSPGAQYSLQWVAGTSFNTPLLPSMISLLPIKEALTESKGSLFHIWTVLIITRLLHKIQMIDVLLREEGFLLP